jgi:hypothetical protein
LTPSGAVNQPLQSEFNYSEVLVECIWSSLLTLFSAIGRSLAIEAPEHTVSQVSLLLLLCT